jgi:hypothetical protein
MRKYQLVTEVSESRPLPSSNRPAGPSIAETRTPHTSRCLAEVDCSHESGLRRLSIAATTKLGSFFLYTRDGLVAGCELSQQAVWPVCRSLSVVANVNVISSV